ncbi:FtsK/SpoIIIE domain-containing protein [Capnocytophaga sputigena]|uniref:FtsK/SpoIIIE domain-containing protein n=1 Tax=Capnocytophaga sputigena TaxID=1019 RepID=UPI0028E8E3BC|nr:FtsK/SpoIIIE domain-containing protein [Capnocytophaga sputigena]
MEKNTLSLQLPIALLSKSKVTMRALLEREVAQQECYIKETLKAIEIPFKGSLHPKINRMETVFSIKMKSYFSDDDFEKVQNAFPKGYVLPHSNFIGGEISSRFVQIAIPNQTTHFVYLSEILGSKQFKHSTMLLPIALGMNEEDLHLIDLTTEAHLAIQADDPSYQSKLQQLVLLSLIYKHSPETLKIVWIGGADDCPPAMLQVIAPYAFSTATDTEEILQSLVDENQKRTENALSSPYIVVFINEADTLFEKHFLLLNALKDSQAQGIYLVGISEVFERKSITVKQLLDYRLLFSNLLWVHDNREVGYEHTSLLLPFFEEEVFDNIIEFREGKIKIPPEELLSERAETLQKQIAQILENRSNTLLERKTLKDLKKTLHTPLVMRSQLCSTDGAIILPLNVIRGYFSRLLQTKLFNEMLGRVMDNITYFAGETPKKLGSITHFEILKESKQILIDGEPLHTHSIGDSLAPFIVEDDYDILNPIAVTPEKVVCPLLDTLPNATYPQLSLIVKKLREVEPIPSNLEEKALLVHKLFNNSIFTWQLSPIALLSEIEMILLRIDFELINKKFLRTREQTAVNS